MRTSMFGLAMAFAATVLVHAETPQETFDKNLKNAQEVAKRQEDARQHELMRDKSHDFPRVKVSDGASVGGSVGPNGVGVDVKVDTDGKRH